MQNDLDEIMALCEQVSNCNHIKQAKTLITQISILMGWEYWVYTAQIPLKLSKNKLLLLSNLPYTWLTYYYFNKLIKIDTVVNYASTHILPASWEIDNVNRYDPSKNDIKFHKALKKFGWTGGVAMPVYTQLSRGIIHFVTKKPFSTKEKLVPITKLLGPSIGLIIQDRLLKLVIEPKLGISGRLSTREMEVLRYAADGHASKVIADKIGIAERTVVEYLQTAAKKLGTTSKDENLKLEGKNRQELILKAYAFGLLHQSIDWDKDTLLNDLHFEEHEIENSTHHFDFSNSIK